MEGRDVLLMSPTGSGKSLVYQLPALALDGVTLVVSPLIALMKDQVDALQKKGIAAAALNSSISVKQQDEAIRAAIDGELDLLYVTPERFKTKKWQAIEDQIHVARLAIDEAHCISQWGHDFRPDYARLGEYRKRLGSPPTVAMTATATKKVISDVVKTLELEKPLILRAGIERKNLFMACTKVKVSDEKVLLIASRIAEMGGPGIVYSTVIKDLELLRDALRALGVPSLIYHGKLPDKERREMQDAFMAADDQVVLATSAFGMGVDKADIRFVINAQVPGNLEDWMQAIGRGGRDGLNTWCELVYLEEDLAIQQSFIEWANPDFEFVHRVYETLCEWGDRVQTKDLDDLKRAVGIETKADQRLSLCMRWLNAMGVIEGGFSDHSLGIVAPLDPAELPDFVKDGGKLERDLKALYRMMRFAKSRKVCRRVLLSRYFDLPQPRGHCGACDNCVDATRWRRREMERRDGVELEFPDVAEPDAPVRRKQRKRPAKRTPRPEAVPKVAAESNGDPGAKKKRRRRRRGRKSTGSEANGEASGAARTGKDGTSNGQADGGGPARKKRRRRRRRKSASTPTPE
jgi:ATP-dependent DNA helicase RecQ